MGIARDTYRAVLLLAVGVLLLEADGLRRREPPTVATQAAYQPPQWHPIVIQQPPPQPDRPIRRVAAAVMEFGDSVIGVFR